MNGVWKTKNLHSHLVDIVMASVGSLEWGVVIRMYKPDNEAGKVTPQTKTMELMVMGHHGNARTIMGNAGKSSVTFTLGIRMSPINRTRK